jgi:hypothetical protein
MLDIRRGPIRRSPSKSQFAARTPGFLEGPRKPAPVFGHRAAPGHNAFDAVPTEPSLPDSPTRQDPCRCGRTGLGPLPLPAQRTQYELSRTGLPTCVACSHQTLRIFGHQAAAYMALNPAVAKTTVLRLTLVSQPQTRTKMR